MPSAAGAAAGVARPASSSRFSDVSKRRENTALFTSTAPLSTGASARPRSARSASMTDRNTFGVPDAHVLAARGDVELARHVAVKADAAVETHEPAAQTRGQPVEPRARRIERDAPVHGLERVRQGEVPDAAARDGRAAREDGRVERAPHVSREVGPARAADVAEEALQDRRGSRRPWRAAQPRRSARPTVPLTSRLVSSPTSRMRSTCTTCRSIEKSNGPIVPQRGSRRAACRPDRPCRPPAGARRRLSSPTTRMLPLTTAVVKGDNRGWNARTYGSRDVSVNRNVSSASDSGVSATRPVADTDETRRGGLELDRQDRVRARRGVP